MNKTNKESWLDPLTNEDIKNYLDNKYSYFYNGTILYHLIDYAVNFVDNDQGKRTGVNIYVEYVDDYDNVKDCYTCGEFLDNERDVQYLLNNNSWAMLIDQKNEGRKIDGKTYQQARIEFLKTRIENHYDMQHKLLNKEKEELLKKANRMLKDIAVEQEKE